MPTTGCDTLVVLGAGTRAGHTLFAKNSDRPPEECQPLFSEPRTTHESGATVRCQYLEIPEVAETLAVLGSRPWWLWGLEHGVNECRVAIGNEALHTRDELPEVGLLGMDLVRLGLERGRTAAEAMGVIVDLVERHGQGGNAAHGTSRRYHNSFIVADPVEAWVIETSGRHWVARRVRDRAAISNLATIGADWDAASAGIEEHARTRGWWGGQAGARLDFRAAFEDPGPRYRAAARLDASCRFLASHEGPTVASMMRHLRDHYDSGPVHRPGRADGDPRGWSICMHPRPGTSATAAGMVVELPRDPAVPMGIWCCLATPCTSVFLPIDLSECLPGPLGAGGETPSADSAWWTLKALSDAVMVDPAARTPTVQETWGAWESELLAAWRLDPEAVRAGGAGRVATMLDVARRLADSVGQPETCRGSR